MRSLLAARPDDYERLVRKWIAIASPFGGAPGFGMDALLTGVQFCQARTLCLLRGHLLELWRCRSGDGCARPPLCPRQRVRTASGCR